MKNTFFTLVTLCLSVNALCQNQGTFEPIEHLLSTPNAYRNAAGAPGHAYWQQQVDYKMNIILDDDQQKIKGVAQITYHNNSRDQLDYLWLELYQNAIDKSSDAYCRHHGILNKEIPEEQMDEILLFDHKGAFKIHSVKDVYNNTLPFHIHKTNMMIDLPKGIKTKSQYQFIIEWEVNLPDIILAHSGYEFFEADGNYLYAIAQFYPRLHYYGDHTGWQHKPYLGTGEFNNQFGNFEVSIDVPSYMVVMATGSLINQKEVLNETQLTRLQKAASSNSPIYIITPEEAKGAEKKKSKLRKTYQFKAERVRDFAFAASRKFIWEAMKLNEEETQLAMSFYPKEAEGLWKKEAVKLAAHTIEQYAQYTRMPYPYPHVSVINIANSEMEYPMMGLISGRSEIGSAIDEAYKNQIYETIIHEVGHNYFPMIVNSDERQWMWMDEGLNTFLMQRAITAWDANWFSLAANLDVLPTLLHSDQKAAHSPIMTESDNLKNSLVDAYGKPSVALRVLRAYIMGETIFDRAFKTFVKRWAFKHPIPTDFFRTMEDASGMDLDWFWKEWFYEQDHVDVELTFVKLHEVNNAESTLVSNIEVISSVTYRSDQKEKLKQTPYLYSLTFTNKGGLVTPIELQFQFEDDAIQMMTIPVEIWRNQEEQFTKIFPMPQRIKAILIDPENKSADVDRENNRWVKKE